MDRLLADVSMQSACQQSDTLKKSKQRATKGCVDFILLAGAYQHRVSAVCYTDFRNNRAYAVSRKTRIFLIRIEGFRS
jgi:hypothetical protein